MAKKYQTQTNYKIIKENAMKAIIIIASIAAIVAFILTRKITLRITYTDRLRAYIKVFFVKTWEYPENNEKKRYPHSMSKRKAQKIKDSLKKKPKEEKKLKKTSKKNEGKRQEQDPNSILSILSIMLSFVKNFVQIFARSVRVKASRIKITVASEDAAETAITYAAVTQTINVLFPLLDDLKMVKKLPRGKELSVNIDYLTDTPTYDVDVELYVRIGSAIKGICKAAIKAFKKAVKKEFKRLERQR